MTCLHLIHRQAKGTGDKGNRGQRITARSYRLKILMGYLSAFKYMFSQVSKLVLRDWRKPDKTI